MICVNVKRERLLQLIDKTIKATEKLNYAMDWPTGVLSYGIVKAWEATKNSGYYELLKNRTEMILGNDKPKHINTVAMGHALISLYNMEHKQIYMNNINLFADFIVNDARKFGEGVLQHTVSGEDDFPGQAWVDTLFMAGLVMVKAGVLLENKVYLEEGIKQFVWHIRLLQNKETGLFYHGWDNVNKNNMSAVHWGRGNAWAAITLAETIKAMPKEHPAYEEISLSLEKLLEALQALQTPEGLWHTVLNDQNTYLETSASAGIATGMCITGNEKYIDTIRRALNAVANNVNQQGEVEGVSIGTAVMKNVQEYSSIPIGLRPYGQGLALALMSYCLNNRNIVDD